MKAIAKSLRRLEDQFGPADRKPRNYSRMVLRPAGLCKLDLENSTCRRILRPNGTVHESIILAPGSNGCTLTDDELDRWIAGFPDCPERRIRNLMKHALVIKKCGWLLQAAGR
jgi:hypothetical protein